MGKVKHSGLSAEEKCKNADDKRVYSGVGFENKVKFALWVYPETIAEVEKLYQDDNCSSKSEFIEKAIKFYAGYLHQNESINYISPLLSSIMESAVLGTEQRLSRLLFKISVELSKLSHVMAATQEIDQKTLADLQAMCVNEVKRINGVISYEKAVEFQKED